jgi:hypothetical protein
MPRLENAVVSGFEDEDDQSTGCIVPGPGVTAGARAGHRSRRRPAAKQVRRGRLRDGIDDVLQFSVWGRKDLNSVLSSRTEDLLLLGVVAQRKTVAQLGGT